MITINSLQPRQASLPLCKHDTMNSNSKRPRYPHPENGSIRAILLENPSTRLYIHPLAWSASHLENLSFVLHHLPPHLEPKNVDEPVPDFSSRSIYKWTGFCKEIAGIQACESRSETDQLIGYLVRDLAVALTGIQLRRSLSSFLPKTVFHNS